MFKFEVTIMVVLKLTASVIKPNSQNIRHFVIRNKSIFQLQTS